MTSRGAALPLVLWGIALLGGLVILVASRMSEGLEEESWEGKLVRARQLALSGLALGRHPGIQPGDPLLRQGNPETEGWEVRFSDESGRLNPAFYIAEGERGALVALFRAWGVEDRMAQAAVDSLADWMDADDFRSLAGAESPEYLQHGLRGLPPNSPPRSLGELEMVLHLRDVLAEKENWQDYFTVLHEGRINIHHAPPALLRDLAGLDPLQIERLEQFLAGRDGVRHTEDDAEFARIEQAMGVAGAAGAQAEALRKWFGVEGQSRRIESTGFCGGVRRTISVVVSEDGSSILAWEER